MKKYLFLLLIGAASLTACGDDDDPVVPELNKLTKVSCYKDGASSPLFTVNASIIGGILTVSEVSAIGSVSNIIFLRAAAPLCGAGLFSCTSAVMPSPFNLA